MNDDRLGLTYKVVDSEFFKEQNGQNYAKIKEMLKEVGIYLDITDNVLYLGIMQDIYNKCKTRNAGRRMNTFQNDRKKNNKCYRYADIVFMLQNMTDKKICEKIKIPQATYYRHKKRLLESDYYKSLDVNKLNDKKYLQSVDGNRVF